MPDGGRNERREALAPQPVSTCPAVSCDAGGLGEVQINYPQCAGTRPPLISAPPRVYHCTSACTPYLQRSETLMHLTLSQAAKHVGMNKATLSRYIKQGKISAVKQEDGSYHIDPSELDRLRELMGIDTRDATPSVLSASPGEMALLRELLEEKDRTMAEKDRLIQNLMQERDEWREQCKKQLVLLPPVTPQKKREWRFWRG